MVFKSDLDQANKLKFAFAPIEANCLFAFVHIQSLGLHPDSIECSII